MRIKRYNYYMKLMYCFTGFRYLVQWKNSMLKLEGTFALNFEWRNSKGILSTVANHIPVARLYFQYFFSTHMNTIIPLYSTVGGANHVDCIN